MPLDFPNSPTDGQTFVSGSVSYVYVAAKGTWDLVGWTFPVINDSDLIIAAQVFR